MRNFGWWNTCNGQYGDHHGPGGELEEAVVGQILAPPQYIPPDGRVRAGYGHFGVFSAELVIKSISDISIKPNPTYDYGEILKHIGPARCTLRAPGTTWGREAALAGSHNGRYEKRGAGWAM